MLAGVSRHHLATITAKKTCAFYFHLVFTLDSSIADREATWLPSRRLPYDVRCRRDASVYRRACLQQQAAPSFSACTFHLHAGNLKHIVFDSPSSVCYAIALHTALHTIFAFTAFHQVCAKLRKHKDHIVILAKC